MAVIIASFVSISATNDPKHCIQSFSNAALQWRSLPMALHKCPVLFMMAWNRSLSSLPIGHWSHRYRIQFTRWMRIIGDRLLRWMEKHRMNQIFRLLISTGQRLREHKLQLNYGARWRIGRSHAFRPKGRGFESRSSRHLGTLGKSFTRSCLWRLGLKLQHSIRAVSGAALSSGRLGGAL